MKYFVGITPDQEVRDRIDNLRKQFPGRLSQHVEPHITIIPPHEYTQVSVLIKGVLAGLARTSNCQIRLGVPAYFGKRVLYFSVHSPDQALHSLRNAVLNAVNEQLLQAKLPPVEDERTFHPHLTLAMVSFGTPFSVMGEMEETAKQMVAHFEPFTIQGLRVYKRAAKGWEVWRDFAF